MNANKFGLNTTDNNSNNSQQSVRDEGPLVGQLYMINAYVCVWVWVC